MRKEEIKIPSEFQDRINNSVQSAKRSNMIIRNGKAIALATMILFSGSLLNPHVRAAAAEMPVVREILTWFTRDQGLQTAVNNDYVLGERVVESNGYKLYLKDVYLDEGNFSIQLALEDKDGKSVKIEEMTLFSRLFGSYLNYRNFFNEQMNPWVEISCNVDTESLYAEHNFYRGQVKLSFNIKHGEKEVKFKNIIFDESELGQAKAKSYEIGETLECGVVLKEIRNYPSKNSIVVSLDELKRRESYCDLQEIVLEDIKGKSYVFKPSAVINDEVIFENNEPIYYQEDNKFVHMEASILNCNIETSEYIDIYDMKKNGVYQKDINFGNDKIEVEIVDISKIKLNVGHVDSMYVVETYGEWNTFYTPVNEVKKTTIIDKIEIEQLLNTTVEEIMSLEKREFKVACEKVADYVFVKDNEIDIKNKEAAYYREVFSQLKNHRKFLFSQQEQAPALYARLKSSKIRLGKVLKDDCNIEKVTLDLNY